jgi:hypothetical protein
MSKERSKGASGMLQISGPGATAAGVGKRDGFDEADPAAASLQQQQNIPA